MNKSYEEAVEIARYISNFKDEYAPSHLSESPHTLKSYEMALTLYIGFLETQEHISSEQFNKHCFESDMIEKWLKWLKDVRGCSPETCNNRLAALRAFLKYLGSRDIKYLYLSTEAKTVKRRKTTAPKAVGLSREAVKALLEAPDQDSLIGRRDLTLMVVLYGTAARIDEILSLKMNQVHMEGPKPHIQVIGKGDKGRTLYLLPKAVEHLKYYIEDYHGDNPDPDSFLFYSRIKGKGHKITQPAISKMLRKYAAIAHEKCHEVPLDLHAHQFRHAKASHWLEDGLNIVQISLLLGHAQLETTMIYLSITPEQKIEALATLQTENDKKIQAKWKGKISSLSEMCGLKQLK